MNAVTNLAAIPKPMNMSDVIIIHNSLKRQNKYINSNKLFSFKLLIYGSIGMKSRGPMKVNPIKHNTEPNRQSFFGSNYLLGNVSEFIEIHLY